MSELSEKNEAEGKEGERKRGKKRSQLKILHAEVTCKAERWIAEKCQCHCAYAVISSRSVPSLRVEGKGREGREGEGGGGKGRHLISRGPKYAVPQGLGCSAHGYS